MLRAYDRQQERIGPERSGRSRRPRAVRCGAELSGASNIVRSFLPCRSGAAYGGRAIGEPEGIRCERGGRSPSSRLNVSGRIEVED